MGINDTIDPLFLTASDWFGAQPPPYTTNRESTAATVDSCFELLGSRQHGVARHLEEQPSESNVPPNARGSDLGQA